MGSVVRPRSVFFEASALNGLAVDWVGPGASTLSGFEAEQIVAEPRMWLRRVHPDDRDAMNQHLTALRYREFVAVEYRWRGRDGAYRWVRQEAVIWQDVNGRRRDHIVGCWTHMEDRQVPSMG